MRTQNLRAPFLSFILLVLASAAAANNVVARATGNWNTASNWARELTGTISVANNSTSVTGVGTSFLTELAQGDVMTLSDGTVIGTVSTVNGNTSVTLSAQNSGGKTGVTWGKQAVPQSGDNVTIGGNLTVTLDAASVTVNSLTMQATIGANGSSVLSIGAVTLTVSNDLAMNGGSNSNRTTKIAFTAGGTLNVSGNVTIGSGNTGTATIDMTGQAATLKVGKALSRNTAEGVFSAGALSTVEYTGTANQTIDLTNFTYANLKSSNTATATLGAAITAANVTGNLDVTTGTLSTGATNLNITLAAGKALAIAAAGTLSSGTSSLNIPGGIALSGTLKTGNTNGYSGAANTNGSGAQTIPVAPAFRNLTVSGSGTKTVASGTLSVAGNFNVSATLNLSTNNPGVTISGNLSGTGAIQMGAGTVTIGANWTNSGTFPTGINANFTSAATTAVPAGTFGALGLSGAKMLAGDVAATSIALSGNAQVTLDANSLTMGSITGGNQNNFIITNSTGTLNATGTSMTFPIGVGAALYTPVLITGDVSRPWAVRAQSGFSGYPATGTSGALPVVWNITPAGTVTADVTFQYDETQFSGFALPAYFNIYHWATPPPPNVNNSSPKWVLAADSVTAGGTPGGLRTILLSSQDSFSPFAISSTESPLPVHLLSFSGRRSGNGALLSWTTVSESMNGGFEIQHATDNIHFTTVGFVSSQAVDGNSNRMLTYSFADASPLNGRVYYRLKQRDLDGRGRTSQTISLTGLAGGELTIGKLYPNPVHKTAQVSVEASAAGTLTVRLISPSGSVVRTSTMTTGIGANTVSVDTEGLASGNYVLQVTDAEGNKGSIRFVKQ